MQKMITSKLQIIAATILMGASVPTPALPIPKMVNACWKPLPLNYSKTIGRFSQRSNLREDGAAAPLPESPGLQNFGKNCVPKITA